MEKIMKNISLNYFFILFCISVMLFFSSTMVQSQTLNDRAQTASMRKAELFTEAGEYDRAKKTYDQLLNEFVPDWQRAIIQYNMGTVLLHQQKWKEAIQQFILADKIQGLSPLLKKNIAVNRSLARLMKVKTNRRKNDYQFKLALINAKKAFDSINIAEKKCCSLDRFEGAQQCPDHLEIILMKNEVDRLMADIIYDYLTYKLIKPYDKPSAHKTSSPKTFQQPEPQNSIENEKEKTKNSESFNSILQQLQSMEEDDHSQPHLQSSTPTSKESNRRPW